MLHVSASLLAADYARLGEEVRRAESAGVDSFHFDMMDGHYVPNLALAPDHLTALRPYASLPFHVHLELSNPDEVLSGLQSFGADAIIVQWDTLAHPLDTFQVIRSDGAKIGLGLSPESQIEEIVRFVREIDLLLILGVYPGFGGQSMLPGTEERVRAARRLAEDLNPSLAIAVDGGVKPENAALLNKAGADCLVMGTALFQAHDMKQMVKEIRESAAASLRR
jgi:ribulose-phosphate 3-epimerase